MDDEDRKIGMLIAAFHDQRQQLQATLDVLGQTGAQLQREVRGAAKGAVEAALADLKLPIHEAGQALIDLQGLSLRRAALQHLAVAVVATVVTLLGVWWYVPAQSDIAARRAERDQLEASIEDLTKRGAKMKIQTCGPNGRFCVLIDRAAGTFGVGGNKGDAYMIAKGY